MTNADASLIDDARTRCLCDVGRDDYIAATAVAADGSEHLVLARCDALGDENVRYDPTCAHVSHEQLGPLSLEFVRRITAARRAHRCGRRTKSGAPCQSPVARAGDTCAWHRTGART
jgi:hypothetical protein